MAKGIREREFQNLMIQLSLPLGWGFTAGRSLPRETTQTVVAGQLRDAIIRFNPEVINGFDVDAVDDGGDGRDGGSFSLGRLSTW